MKRLDTTTKNAIISDRLAGIPGEVVGRKYGIHEASVARLVSQFRKQTDSKAEIHQTAGDYRTRLLDKSIRAIEAGLDPKPDKYKAGNLGISVMKGIGEFEGDKVSVGGILVSVNLPSTLKLPDDLVVDGKPVYDLPKEPAQPQEQSKPFALPEAGDRADEPPKGKSEDPEN